MKTPLPPIFLLLTGGVMAVVSGQLPLVFSLLGYVLLALGAYLLLARVFRWPSANTVEDLQRALIQAAILEIAILLPIFVVCAFPVWKHSYSVSTVLAGLFSISFWLWVALWVRHHPSKGAAVLSEVGLALHLLALLYQWTFLLSAAREAVYLLQTRLHFGESADRVLVTFFEVWNMAFVLATVGGFVAFRLLRRLAALSEALRHWGQPSRIKIASGG